MIPWHGDGGQESRFGDRRNDYEMIRLEMMEDGSKPVMMMMDRN